LGQAYSDTPVVGYNSGAPSDDGSQTTANKVKFATVKTVLTDPLNTALAAINTKLDTALDFGGRQISSADTAGPADDMRSIVIEATATVICTLPDCTTMGPGYTLNYINIGTGIVEFQLATLTDSIMNITGGVAAIDANSAITFRIVPGEEGYYVVNATGTVLVNGADYTTSSLSAGPAFGVIPPNVQSANYTTVLADTGKNIIHPSSDTTARTFTIDSHADVPYVSGACLTFTNEPEAGDLTIAITSDTMYLAGAGTTGSRTLAAPGVATAVRLSETTDWIISGVGLT
jgi:hypothetical protein